MLRGCTLFVCNEIVRACVCDTHLDFQRSRRVIGVTKVDKPETPVCTWGVNTRWFIGLRAGVLGGREGRTWTFCS